VFPTYLVTTALATIRMQPLAENVLCKHPADGLKSSTASLAG
jgi:hypothetical protein